MDVSPHPSPTPPIDVAKTIERARAAWAAGRADEAEMACRQVLAVWPGQADATYLLGLMAYRYRQSRPRHCPLASGLPGAARARRHFQRLRRDVPADAGCSPRAKQAGRRAVALAPNFAAAWNNLGIILQDMLKLDESRLCLERALALDAGQPADAQQSRQHLQAPRACGGGGKALERGAGAQARLRRGLQQPFQSAQRPGRVRPR